MQRYISQLWDVLWFLSSLFAGCSANCNASFALRSWVEPSGYRHNVSRPKQTRHSSAQKKTQDNKLSSWALHFLYFIHSICARVDWRPLMKIILLHTLPRCVHLSTKACGIPLFLLNASSNPCTSGAVEFSAWVQFSKVPLLDNKQGKAAEAAKAGSEHKWRAPASHHVKRYRTTRNSFCLCFGFMQSEHRQTVFAIDLQEKTKAFALTNSNF